MFENCQFVNFDNEGILLYDAGARITKENQFIGNHRGISSLATYPFGAALEIGSFGETPNLFMDNDIHIDISANTKLGGVQIVNNEFFEGRYGIWLEGPNNYVIENNVFEEMDGAIVGFLTGEKNAFQSNLISCNVISTKNFGIGFFGENRQVRFLSNDFSTANRDVYLFGLQSLPSAIRKYQGNVSLAADNCFTNPQQGADISTIGTAAAFRYYRDPSTVELCKTPTTRGNYTVHNSFDDNGLDCDSDGFQGDTPTKTKLIQERDARLAIEQINDWESDPALEEEWLRLRDQQEYYLKGVLIDLKAQGDWAEVESILLGENTEEAKMVLYAIHANNGVYNKAEQYLATIASSDGLLETFKGIQKINLERLQEGSSFELSNDELVTLEELAKSESALRGFAQNILTLTIGTRFDRVLPDFPAIQAIQSLTSNPISTLGNRARVYPNPAEEILNIDLKDMNFEAGSLEVINLLGQLVLSHDFNAEGILMLDVSELKAGLYHIQIQLDGANQHPIKVVLE